MRTQAEQWKCYEKKNPSLEKGIMRNPHQFKTLKINHAENTKGTKTNKMNRFFQSSLTKKNIIVKDLWGDWPGSQLLACLLFY